MVKKRERSTKDATAKYGAVIIGWKPSKVGCPVWILRARKVKSADVQIAMGCFGIDELVLEPTWDFSPIFKKAGELKLVRQATVPAYARTTSAKFVSGQKSANSAPR